MVVMGKTKYILGTLTKMALLGSMVLSIGRYTMFFGFPYVVGIVVLALVHEAGHVASWYCFLIHGVDVIHGHCHCHELTTTHQSLQLCKSYMYK